MMKNSCYGCIYIFPEKYHKKKKKAIKEEGKKRNVKSYNCMGISLYVLPMGFSLHKDDQHVSKSD